MDDTCGVFFMSGLVRTDEVLSCSAKKVPKEALPEICAGFAGTLVLQSQWGFPDVTSLCRCKRAVSLPLPCGPYPQYSA